MDLQITINDNDTEQDVNFAPASELEEVIQNVRTLCATPKNSVPLDREFGIDQKILDLPLNKAAAKIESEIWQAIKKYEPRCVITKFACEYARDGIMNLSIRIKLNDSLENN